MTYPIIEITVPEIVDFMKILKTQDRKKIVKYVSDLADAYKDNGYSEGWDDGHAAGLDDM